MSRSARLLAVALPLSLVFFSSIASAQSDADKATARTLGTEAQTALDAKDYKTAEDKFRRADSIYHAPTLLLGLARAQAALGRVVAAQESYSRVIREGAPAGGPAAFAKAVEDAKKEVDVASARIGGVIINVTGVTNTDSTKVTVDDTLIPTAALGVKRPIDPGPHTLKVTSDGYKPVSKPFDVVEGGAKPAVVDVAMEKDPNAVAAVVPPGPTGPTGTSTTTTTQPVGNGVVTPPPGADTGGSSTKTMGFVALGVGAIGLVAGSVTGILALSKHADLANNCKGPDGTCTDSSKVKQSDLDTYHTMGTISTIGFIVAGVGAVAGTVLILTAPKETHTAKTTPSRPWISPYVGVASAGALGQF
ncbi:MAG: hypothetical protein JWM74_1417 [Myxococcaceae bacterium]|nr:hypothetical protein [Myxococcaceae bacterium]